MIHEWLMEDGRVATYDPESDLFLYLNIDRSPLEAPRQPTEQELADYHEKYPVVTAQISTAPTRAQLIANLVQTLTVLRGVTADQAVTSSEINTAFGVVVPSLEKLRDYGPQLDDELVYLTVLVLSQISMSLFILANQIGAGYRAIAEPQYVLREDLNTLTAAVDQLRADLEAHEH
jgi:hypothetical protein